MLKLKPDLGHFQSLIKNVPVRISRCVFFYGSSVRAACVDCIISLVIIFHNSKRYYIKFAQRIWSYWMFRWTHMSLFIWKTRNANICLPGILVDAYQVYDINMSTMRGNMVRSCRQPGDKKSSNADSWRLIEKEKRNTHMAQ